MQFDVVYLSLKLLVCQVYLAVKIFSN